MAVIEGNLRIVGLPDIIQMECMSGRSGSISITSLSGVGSIHYVEGNITHVATGSLVDEEAMVELLAVREGTFRVDELKQGTPATIQRNWQKFMMDCIVRLDERQHQSDDEQEALEKPRPGPLSGLASLVSGVSAIQVTKPDGTTLLHMEEETEYLQSMHRYLEKVGDELAESFGGDTVRGIAIKGVETVYVEIRSTQYEVSATFEQGTHLASARRELETALLRSMP